MLMLHRVAAVLRGFMEFANSKESCILYLFWAALFMLVFMSVFSVLILHRFARSLHGIEKLANSAGSCMLYLSGPLWACSYYD